MVFLLIYVSRSTLLNKKGAQMIKVILWCIVIRMSIEFAQQTLKWKKPAAYCRPFFIVAGLGFEPRTSGLWALSYVRTPKTVGLPINAIPHGLRFRSTRQYVVLITTDRYRTRNVIIPKWWYSNVEDCVLLIVILILWTTVGPVSRFNWADKYCLC